MKSVRMLCFAAFIMAFFILNAYGQDIILGSKLVGTLVQGFTAPAGEFIEGFTVSTSGEYAVLTAYSATGSGDIFQTKLLGMEVDAFTPISGYIDEFTIGGPDGNGYVHLIAHSSNGIESDTIFRTKLVGTGVNNFTAPVGEYVNSIRDTVINEYIYLIIGTAPLGIFEVTGFTAVPKRSYVLLKWRTEAELNSYQWLIERKVAGGEYETIGRLDAQGNASHPTDYRYEDRVVEFGGKYYYRLIEIDTEGKSSYFGPLFVDLSTSDYIPRKMFVNQNYPNPFQRMTSIKFGIPMRSKEDYARLVVYDVTGRLTRTLISGKLEPGYYHINWNGKDERGREVTSGVYFYRLSVGNKRMTKKMVYLK